MKSIRHPNFDDVYSFARDEKYAQELANEANRIDFKPVPASFLAKFKPGTFRVANIEGCLPAVIGDLV